MSRNTLNPLRRISSGAFLLLAFLSACGPIRSRSALHNAEAAVAAARQEGAKTHAPYHYYFAEAHLEKAQQADAEGAYESATHWARESERHARQAIDVTQEASSTSADTTREVDAPESEL